MPGVYPAGRLGVGLFFALSGYLITTVLLRESGLRRFYGRRIRRIFPPFYAYLAAVALLCALGVYAWNGVAFGAAATYWINWLPGERGWPLQHTWSLAVEEQFYLTWPLVLAFLGPRRAAAALALVLALWPLQRFVRTGHWGHPSLVEAWGSATYDVILTGCLLALLAHLGWWRNARSALVPLILLGSVYLVALPTVLVPPLRNLGLAGLVLWAARNPDGALGWRPLAGLGRISYSLYLWHVLFCDPRLRGWLPFPANLLAALAVSWLSYRWLERGAS